MEMKLSWNISLDLLSKIHNNEDSFSEDGRIEKKIIFHIRNQNLQYLCK